MSDILVYLGDEIKVKKDGSVKGYLVRFGNALDTDLEGDFFTKSTNFGRPVNTTFPLHLYYNHGQDPIVGKNQIGTGFVKMDQYGLWYEAQIDMNDKYNQMIAKLASEGKLGYSSGAASHLVERKQIGNAYEILQWNLAEASLTPRPAESRNMVKNLKELMIACPQCKSMYDGVECKKCGYKPMKEMQCPDCMESYDGVECKKCGYKPMKDMGEDPYEEPLNPVNIFEGVGNEIVLESIETLNERLSEAIYMFMEGQPVDIDATFQQYVTLSKIMIDKISSMKSFEDEIKFYNKKKEKPHRPYSVRDAEKTLREVMCLSNSESKKLANILWRNLCDADLSDSTFPVAESKSVTDNKLMLLKKAMLDILESK